MGKSIVKHGTVCGYIHVLIKNSCITDIHTIPLTFQQTLQLLAPEVGLVQLQMLLISLLALIPQRTEHCVCCLAYKDNMT